ncbi:MAG: hypothetical protein QM791_22440 [Ferruginibacter sp.]
MSDSLNKLKNQINGIKNTDSLYAFMKQKGIEKDSISRVQQLLLSVNRIGIGRSWVDYSELTVKNISVSGVNMEMNPGNLYFAFAAGKVNYRFGDFVYKDNEKAPSQNLYLVRAGIGKKEKNNFIATFYNGTKSVFNASLGNGVQPVENVTGVSLEARINVDDNNYFIGEIAKSSSAENFSSAPSVPGRRDKIFDFRTHTNEAYSIRFYSQNPSTGTKLNAYYKKIGQNFKSYNLFPVNMNQDAWMIKVNQYLWQRKFVLEAAVRKNDFASPFAASSYSSSTVFKSLQVSLRVPKYPFVSVGYMPSSQLIVYNGNRLSESQYNTLNAVVNHAYRVKGIAMNTSIFFTKFYNDGVDTGFTYYNASTSTISHNIYISPFTLQTGISISAQKAFHLFTLDQQLSWQLTNNISLAGGLKWNRHNHVKSLLGSTTGMNIYLKNIGSIQVNYDKTFLPGFNRELIPVNIGRMSFYRQF